MNGKNEQNALTEVATRIRELRNICGFSEQKMADVTHVSLEDYVMYESGTVDLPFTFLHGCARALGVELTDIMEGGSAKLSNYTVTRKGEGKITAQEQGIEIVGLANRFKQKIASPYSVRYSFDEELQNKPIHLTSHSGQEFDLVISGKLKVQVGEHTEILSEGDSIYYNSDIPHGMIAVDGEDCNFLAVVLAQDEKEVSAAAETITGVVSGHSAVAEPFITTVEDSRGALESISFQNADKFNFAFDVVDELAKRDPDKLAMLHLDRNKVERRFSFEDLSRMSSRAANYFTALGIHRGDKVLVVLRRNYQFWITVLALHKIGAVAVPATDQLQKKDFVYRFNKINAKAIIATADSHVSDEIEKSLPESPSVEIKVMTNGCREGWHDFDAEYSMYRSTYLRTEDAPCGDDSMLMYFTSGTSGYPKVVRHSYKYALGHYVTAKYWHCVDPNGLHFAISDTGWGKAAWGKLYGQWLCEAAIFTYDFDRFNANDILPLFAKYHITTFCAPPTMYRFLIKEDLSRFDLSSIQHACIAGEALNPEVFYQFKKATGLSLMEGFGQTETTLVIGNFIGMKPKPGSMGKPNPLYHVGLVNHDDTPVEPGNVGEIVIYTDKGAPCGLFCGYEGSPELTADQWHDNIFHTGDTAWCDEDGHFWYVGRVDDLIKSSGYRIGPFEIESTIMELPYVLECGVSPEPDPIRGQVVKASIVLTKGTEPTEELKREIQDYVKKHTAPYKYPRIVVFRESLPKTISGKIQRNQL